VGRIVAVNVSESLAELRPLVRAATRRFIEFPTWISTWFVACIVATACGQAPSATPSPSLQTIVPAADMFGVTWLDSGTLVVGYSPGQASGPFRLAQVDVKSGDIAQLPDPPSDGCHRVRQTDPTRLPDGLLGFVYVCQPKLGSGELERSSIWTLDLATSAYAPLVEIKTSNFLAGQITADPTLSTFLVAFGNQLCNTILEVDGSTRALPLEVGDGTAHFRLDDARALDTDCSGTGWATLPAWSPDGAHIALFAAPSAAGVDGPRRGEVPSALVMTDPTYKTADVVLRDIVVPRGLAFSPTGEMLAFGGTVAGDRGTWLLEWRTRQLRRLADVRFAWLAWTPDGSRIAAIRSLGDVSSLNRELVVIPVR
jgi:hypothetical protein